MEHKTISRYKMRVVMDNLFICEKTRRFEVYAYSPVKNNEVVIHKTSHLMCVTSKYSISRYVIAALSKRQNDVN